MAERRLFGLTGLGAGACPGFWPEDSGRAGELVFVHRGWMEFISIASDRRALVCFES